MPVYSRSTCLAEDGDARKKRPAGLANWQLYMYIFSIGLEWRLVLCFRCRFYEEYFIAHMLCIVIFPFVGDTEFTLGEFLLLRRVST